MAITKEYIDSISFDIAKQKYYNANKVDAVLDEFKAGVMELIAENEKLRKGGEKKKEPAVDTSALLSEAKIQAESLIGDAKLKAEKILAQAKQEAAEIVEKAKAEAEQMQANNVGGSTGFSARQLDAIDKINKQLDELNVTQATQIFRLKQALVTMATTK